MKNKKHIDNIYVNNGRDTLDIIKDLSNINSVKSSLKKEIKDLYLKFKDNKTEKDEETAIALVDEFVTPNSNYLYNDYTEYFFKEYEINGETNVIISNLDLVDDFGDFDTAEECLKNFYKGNMYYTEEKLNGDDTDPEYIYGGEDYSEYTDDDDYILYDDIKYFKNEIYYKVQTIAENFKPVVVDKDIPNNDYFSVKIKDKTSGWKFWIDVEIRDNDVDYDWNKYTFNNTDEDILESALQKNSYIFDMATGEAVSYLEDNGYITNGDDGWVDNYHKN